MKRKNAYNFLLFCLSLVACVYVVGCKKSESTPAPDLATQMVGTYKVSSIGIPSLPSSVTADPANASVVVERSGTALDQVNITSSYSYTFTNSLQILKETKLINLQQSGSNVDLYNGTSKVGTWSNNTITATNYPFSTGTINYTASK